MYNEANCDLEALFLDVINCIAHEARSLDLTAFGPFELSFVRARLSGANGDPIRCVALLHDDDLAGNHDWSHSLIALDITNLKTDALPKAPGPIRPGIEPHQGVKRKSSLESASIADPKPPPKRSRISPSDHAPTHPLVIIPPRPYPSSPITTHSADTLAHYALEMMSATGNRRHVLGVAARDFHTFLCYFDRAGSICSTPIHFIDDEIHFIAAFIALSICTSTRLGFEPCIEPPPLSGKPATSIEGCHIEVEGRRFILDRVVHSATTLVGRGTAVYAARPGGMSWFEEDIHPSFDRDMPDVVIVKLSWQVTSRPLEDELFRWAADKGVDGVAKLYYSCVVDKLSDCLRGNLVPPDEYEDRELRIQVIGPLSTPLYRTPNLEQFKFAFISLVQSKLIPFL